LAIDLKARFLSGISAASGLSVLARLPGESHLLLAVESDLLRNTLNLFRTLIPGGGSFIGIFSWSRSAKDIGLFLAIANKLKRTLVEVNQAILAWSFRDYPAFKRKFESFQMNYHRGTPTRELFQQFHEMCLPEKLSAKIKSADTMENAWIRLEAWFGDKGLFIKDLMQDIKSVTPIKEGDDERLMDYYVALQAHIEEARNADALDMLLIPANVELMVVQLTAWEKRIWREAQGRLPAEDRSW
jgi:hypothetical protein